MLSAALLTGCATGSATINYDNFAKCLNEKGVVMYGGISCSHCNEVKKEFGESFTHMNYVECAQGAPGSQRQKCMDESIQYFPTFKFAEGDPLIGQQPFEMLSSRTGCPID